MATRSNKAPTTRASRYVAEEMRHMKSGKHSARHPIKSRKQAVAVGLSKARKAGIKVPGRQKKTA